MIPRPENTESLEEVKEIVVTRLTPYVQDILEQHGCRIEKRELETLLLPFLQIPIVNCCSLQR